MSSEVIYTLKVTLEGSDPPIWRRFQVPGGITLRKLHRVLQEVMGWENYHLYEFVVGEERFGEPDSEEPETKDSGRVRLNRVAPEAGGALTYIYDFGDGWRHEIDVEDIVPTAVKVRSAVCLDGARACPPEDCGGIWGYVDLLAIIENPEHEEYESRIEWLGGRLDRETFDLDVTNRNLLRLK